RARRSLRPGQLTPQPCAPGHSGRVRQPGATCRPDPDRSRTFPGNPRPPRHGVRREVGERADRFPSIDPGPTPGPIDKERFMAPTTEKPAGHKSGAEQTLLLVATRKGAWLYYGDKTRETWRTDGPHFLGHIINHLLLDPRDGRTLLAAAKTGHLGPTIFRSTDFGRNWQEAARPPAFATAADGSGR